MDSTKRLLTNANATERQIEEDQELYLGIADSLRELGYSTSDVIDIRTRYRFMPIGSSPVGFFIRRQS